MDQSKRAQNFHLAGLDGLRGIAVLGVILYHLFPEKIKGGFLGVSLFFILSGYLIALTTRRDLEQQKFTLVRFYRKRILRIYPALVIMVFVTLGIYFILAPEILNGISEQIKSIFGGYNNFWQISQNSSYFTKIANASPFTHLWSLAIELQFYLMWPLWLWLYLLLKQSKFSNYAALVVCLIPILISITTLQLKILPGRDVSELYYGTGTRIFSFFMGAYLGLQPFEEQMVNSRRYQKRRTRYFIGAVLLLGASYLMIDGQSLMTYRVWLVATSLLFLGILRLVLDPNLEAGNLMDNKVLTYFGKRSYEIYLWQFPVIFIFQYLKLDKGFLAPLIIVVLILVLSEWLYFVGKMFYRVR